MSAYVYRADKQINYYTYELSLDGKEILSQKVDSSTWQIQDESMLYFDIMNDKCFWGFAKCNSSDDIQLPEKLRILETDEEGKKEKSIDVKEGLTSLGCNTLPNSLYIDAKGYLYFIVYAETDILYVLDNKGKAFFSYSCREEGTSYISKPVRDEKGRLFFPLYSAAEEKTLLMWINDKGEWTKLAELEGMITLWYTMRGSTILYADQDGLVRWDILTGNREKLLTFRNRGILNYNLCLFRMNEEGSIYIWNYGEEKPWTAQITPDAPVYENPVKVSILAGGRATEYLYSSIAIFSREQNYEIMVEKNQVEEHEHHATDTQNTTLIDLTNGNGPDILYVSYEDMLNLKSKNAILELNEMIPESIRQDIYSNVFEFGNIDNGLYGMPVGVNLHTMFVNKEIYDDETWTIDDVMSLVVKNPQLECVFTSDAEDETLSIFLMDMVSYDIIKETSRFIDWENGRSCFKDNGFVEVLEFVKNNSHDTGKMDFMELELVRDRIVTGKALAYPCIGCDPIFYNQLMDEFGENCYAIGFPSEEGKGNYLEADGFLVVNAKISEEKKQKAKELICYLISKDSQKRLQNCLSILKSTIDDRVYYDEEMDKYYWSDGTTRLIVLQQSKDGSAHMNSYKEIIESAQPYMGTDILCHIVYEECEPFFHGKRTAEEVVSRIDNRVQLYLDENK